MKIKFYECLIVAGFLIWFAETAYFGFNLKAASDVEHYFDVFSVSLIIAGFAVDAFKKREINLIINIDKNFIDIIKKLPE